MLEPRPHAVDATAFMAYVERPPRKDGRYRVVGIGLRRTHIDLNVASEARMDPPGSSTTGRACRGARTRIVSNRSFDRRVLPRSLSPEAGNSVEPPAKTTDSGATVARRSKSARRQARATRLTKGAPLLTTQHEAVRARCFSDAGRNLSPSKLDMGLPSAVTKRARLRVREISCW